MRIEKAALSRLLPVAECIVEERVWLHGAEVVSHVNFTQLERVRTSRGLVLGALGPVSLSWMMDGSLDVELPMSKIA